MPYVFDPTGSLPANLIVDELHTLTEINDVTYRILIPEFAPFYTNNLVVKYNDGVNGDVALQEGVDFVLCLPYLAASRSIGAMVYGGISFNFNYPNGTIKVTYQTIGGEWIADPNYVYERLVNTAYNPRVTVWDTLTNVQQLFPPINHNQELDYVFGYEDLLLKLQEIADAIAASQPHVFNLGIGLDPDRIMMTDLGGKIVTGTLSAADLLAIVNNQGILVTGLNQAQSDINSLDNRVDVLEGIIATGGNLPANLSVRLETLEQNMQDLINQVNLLLLSR